MPTGVYKRTPECNAINSASKKNKKKPPRSLEYRANIAASRRGKHHSKKTIAKMRAAKKDKPLSQEHRDAIKAAMNRDDVRATVSAGCKGKQAGSKHWNWLGGISKQPYSWAFDEKLKEEIRCRDGYICQFCGVPEERCKTNLCVHHIDYNKTNCDYVNLIALCRGCNGKANKNRDYWTVLFQTYMLNRALDDLHSKYFTLSNF